MKVSRNIGEASGLDSSTDKNGPSAVGIQNAVDLLQNFQAAASLNDDRQFRAYSWSGDQPGIVVAELRGALALQTTGF